MDKKIGTKPQPASQKVVATARVSIIQLTGKNVRFLMRRIDPTIAEYLRRSFKMSTPTLAVDWAETDINTSDLPIAKLGRRLQNLVLTSDKTVEQLRYPQQCECAYFCPNCSVTLHVAVTCTGEERRVTFADIESENRDVKPVIVEHAGEVYRDDNLLVKLRKNQTLVLKAFAVKGVGEVHPKWSPCTSVMQKMLQPKEANGDGAEGGTDSEPVAEFNVMSIGSLKPEHIVLMGLKAIIKKFEDLKMTMEQDPGFLQSETE